MEHEKGFEDENFRQEVINDVGRQINSIADNIGASISNLYLGGKVSDQGLILDIPIQFGGEWDATPEDLNKALADNFVNPEGVASLIFQRIQVARAIQDLCVDIFNSEKQRLIQMSEKALRDPSLKPEAVASFINSLFIVYERQDQIDQDALMDYVASSGIYRNINKILEQMVSTSEDDFHATRGSIVIPFRLSCESVGEEQRKKDIELSNQMRNEVKSLTFIGPSIISNNLSHHPEVKVTLARPYQSYDRKSEALFQRISDFEDNSLSLFSYLLNALGTLQLNGNMTFSSLFEHIVIHLEQYAPRSFGFAQAESTRFIQVHEVRRGLLGGADKLIYLEALNGDLKSLYDFVFTIYRNENLPREEISDSLKQYIRDVGNKVKSFRTNPSYSKAIDAIDESIVNLNAIADFYGSVN